MNIQVKVVSREISEYLWRAGQTLSTAESCTAGLVAASIAALPGASTYFRGGVVTYVDELKQQLLGISEEMLQEKGAVSEDVARAMVEGALERLQTDYAIAVTGYAGPGGGPEAPVGTIYVAVGKKGDIVVRELTGDDGREENVARASLTALQMLLEKLKSDFPAPEE
ncbi:MAG: CinA family protein [Bacteroidaceae bacterium]|nr:CinA family protein [Bacteroidaceae bacterium]